jgi:hypothetical protein
MKSRTVLLIVLVVGCAILLVALMAPFLLPGGNITRRNFERIKVGMKEKEVEDILGPKGDYSSGIELAGPAPQWMTNNALVWVWFDSERRVISKDFVVPHLVQESFLGKLRGWLGL